MIDETVLGVWLAERIGADAATVRFAERDAATGFSSETQLFEADITAGRGQATGGFVLRTRPAGVTVFRDYDLETQCRVIEAVRANSQVPVPPIVGYEPNADLIGSDFYVMRQVPGRVPSDQPPYTTEGWLKDEPEDVQREVWTSGLDVLADLHAIDPAEFSFLHRGTDPSAQELFDHERSFAAWATEEVDHPTVDRAIEILANEVPPETNPAGLNWGDSRISNIIYAGSQPAAVLDWEMAALGPPEADVAWFFYMDHFFSEAVGALRLPGLPTTEDSVARYQARSGRKLGDLDWFFRFAALRFAVVMCRVALRVIRQYDLDEGLAHNNIGSRALATLLDLESPGEPGPLG